MELVNLHMYPKKSEKQKNKMKNSKLTLSLKGKSSTINQRQAKELSQPAVVQFTAMRLNSDKKSRKETVSLSKIQYSKQQKKEPLL